jgi:hypothetical protein
VFGSLRERLEQQQTNVPRLQGEEDATFYTIFCYVFCIAGFSGVFFL